jgi:hypothetical protein
METTMARTDEAIIEKRCSGTTTQTSRCKILWKGEHLALLKLSGHNYEGRWRPGSVSLVDQVFAGGTAWGSGYDHPERVDVKLFTPQRNNALTKAKLAELIEIAEKADADYPAQVKEREAAQEETRRQREAAQAKRDAAQTKLDAMRKALDALGEAAKSGKRDSILEAAAKYQQAAEDFEPHRGTPDLF